MGRASRRRRDAQGRAKPTLDARADQDSTTDSRIEAESALHRLLQTNRPGHVSLAGAYALGYAGLGYAQLEGESPDWFDEIDPLDALFLGTVWPQKFRDPYEFGNARTAWLRLMRTTPHWVGIERFVTEVVRTSEEYQLAVDEGELMLLVAGRLEDAGLDQRQLPSPLLPKNALADARFITGPRPDVPLPVPPADAEDRIQLFWVGTDVGLPNDGTVLDALREGMYLLAQANLPVRDHSLMLLVALYVALVARDGDTLDDETADRAHAWALGVPSESPLTPVLDTLLIATERELPPETALAHLFGLNNLENTVPAADRRWHSSPGTELSKLAFDLGSSRLNTRQADLVSLPPGAIAALQAQRRRFEEKFGRPPGPDDPIFFDADSDEPVEVSLAEVERANTAMMDAVGIHPAWIYATQNTGGLMPRPDGTFAESDRDQEWNTAVDRYLRTHPDQPDLDQDIELRKYQSFLAALSVSSVVEDPERGRNLSQRLTTETRGNDAETQLLADMLTAMAPGLVATLRGDKGIRAAAAESARAWSGLAVCERVTACADGEESPKLPDDLPVLLAVLAAQLSRPGGQDTT